MSKIVGEDTNLGFEYNFYTWFTNEIKLYICKNRYKNLEYYLNKNLDRFIKND